MDIESLQVIKIKFNTTSIKNLVRNKLTKNRRVDIQLDEDLQIAYVYQKVGVNFGYKAISDTQLLTWVWITVFKHYL